MARDKIHEFVHNYGWFSLGGAALLGVWWAGMTPAKANLTVVFGVTVVAIGIFTQPWMRAQPLAVRLVWTVLSASVVALVAYYVLWAEPDVSVGNASSTSASTGPLPSDQRSTSVTPSVAQPAPIYLTITPQELSRLYESNTSIQADELMRAYVGKWMRVSGVVRDIVPIREVEGLGVARIVAIFAAAAPVSKRRIDDIRLNLLFADNDIETIRHLKRGDRLQATCRYVRLSPVAFR